jgi:hypothetical protein
MIVYYRMCGIPSTNPSPYLQEDKFKLNKLCLDSFVQAYASIRPKIVFLCDYCGDEYKELLETVPFEYESTFTTIGINHTCLLQYDLAREQDDLILFQECDYLYLPDTGQRMVEAITQLGMVSPYNHRNFYMDQSIHSKTCELELVNNHIWRSVERNTMTFGIRPDVFKSNFTTFEKYGYLDNDVWHDLRASGQPLYVPIPSIATHMVKDYLAPGIEWEDLWTQLSS